MMVLVVIACVCILLFLTCLISTKKFGNVAGLLSLATMITFAQGYYLYVDKYSVTVSSWGKMGAEMIWWLVLVPSLAGYVWGLIWNLINKHAA